MRISSKNTGIFQEIPKWQWDVMIKNGSARNYIIESHSDEDMESTEIEVEPISLFEEEEEATEEAVVEDDDEVAFYKAELDKREIKYHWKTGIEKLKKLYEESL